MGKNVRKASYLLNKMNELFCRFCAESEIDSEIIEFSSDTQVRNEIVQNLSFFPGLVDLTDKSLPEAVCSYCRDYLRLCCDFLTKIRKSQDILHGSKHGNESNAKTIVNGHSLLRENEENPACRQNENTNFQIKDEDILITPYYSGDLELDQELQAKDNVKAKNTDKLQNLDKYGPDCNKYAKDIRHPDAIMMGSCHNEGFNMYEEEAVLIGENRDVDLINPLKLETENNFNNADEYQDGNGDRWNKNTKEKHSPLRNTRTNKEKIILIYDEEYESSSPGSCRNEHVVMQEEEIVLTEQKGATGFKVNPLKLEKDDEVNAVDTQENVLSLTQLEDITVTGSPINDKDCTHSLKSFSILSNLLTNPLRNEKYVSDSELPSPFTKTKLMTRYKSLTNPIKPEECTPLNEFAPSFTKIKELLLDKSLQNKILSAPRIEDSPVIQPTINSKAKELKIHNRPTGGNHIPKNRTKKVFTCNICCKDFEHKSKFDIHMHIHSKRSRDIKCEQCNKMFINLHSLRSHLDEIHKVDPQICPICDKVLQNGRRLYRHKRNHSVSKMKFECDICHHTFTRKGHMAHHIKTVHSNNILYLCKFCGKGFKYKINLTDHENIHKKKKNYKCTECTRKFYSWGNCNKHMKRKHGLSFAKTINTPLGRQPIDQRTGILKDGKNIDKSIIQEEENFTCLICHKTFDSKKYLCDHQKIAQCKIGTQVCPICNLKLANWFNLTKHLPIHKGEGSFECDHCHKIFKLKVNLRNHMLMHINRYPFKCTHCGMQFKRNQYLKLHVNRRHVQKGTEGIMATNFIRHNTDGAVQ